MFVWKVKFFVFWLVIGSTFFMSSCTLPTLWDKWESTPHQAAVSENEPLSNTSSGVQTYTGVLSLSGAVKILEAKERERSKQYEQELLNNSGANYNYDYTDAITQQELQWLSNWLTQEENAIKPYKSFDDMLGNPTKLFEIAIDDEKYYWINWNGNQLWYVQENEHNPYPSIDTDTWIPDQSETSFVFLIRERGEKKDIVYIHCVPWFNFWSIPWIIFDEKNQVFEMRENSWLQFEIDRSFKNKRNVNEYIAPSPFDFDSDEALKKAPLHIQYLWGQDIKYKKSAILYFMIENSPFLRTSLAKVFSVNENDIPKIIESLEKNRATPTLSHMSKEWDLMTFELEWLTFTRLKNLGLPQGKHTYTLPKKAVMEMILVESSILQDEFIDDFGENSGKPFGVALWDKWPNGEDLAWFAWWTSLRPLVVDVDHATYSIPTFDFVFPTMDGAKSLKNEFWRDIVELIQDENSTLPYGSANEKKNLDFAWMRQKNGKIWTASTGNHKWHASDDIDAKSFRPIGGVWWRDITGFTIYLEQSYDYKWQWPRVGDLVPRDAIVIDDRYFYSKKEHKIYHHQYGSWSEISVVGTKVYWVKKYSTLDSPDSLCTSNDEYGKYSYDIYDEKVCYGKSGVVGTRK